MAPTEPATRTSATATMTSIRSRPATSPFAAPTPAAAAVASPRSPRMESGTVACSTEVCSVPVRPPETGSVSALRPARTVDASEGVLAGCPPAGSMTVAEPMTPELTLAATAFAPTRADTLAPSGTPDAVPARAGETEPRAAGGRDRVLPGDPGASLGPRRPWSELRPRPPLPQLPSPGSAPLLWSRCSWCLHLPAKRPPPEQQPAHQIPRRRRDSRQHPDPVLPPAPERSLRPEARQEQGTERRPGPRWQEEAVARRPAVEGATPGRRSHQRPTTP